MALSTPFVVVSWNVLHMVHEINYCFDASPVIDQYSIRTDWRNEKNRINDMAKIILQFLQTNSNVECFICLQEVPGDLVTVLQEILDPTLKSKSSIHVRNYPRIPAVRHRQGPRFYTDIRESLVTIHYNPSGSSDEILWIQCPTDPGKGALTVKTNSGITIVNIHVPFDTDAALSLLKNLPWPTDNSPYVLVGDINRDSRQFIKLLQKLTEGKPNFDLIRSVPSTKPTRIGYCKDGTLGKSWIDHYLISTSLQSSPVVVYDQIGNISDHFPISLSFNP